VRFDAEGIEAPATLSGKICLLSNDAESSNLAIPVTLEVRE